MTTIAHTPLVLQADGACKGNPGPASYGWVLMEGNEVIDSGHARLEGITTNNVAEYTALIHGLVAVNRNHLGRRVHVQMDSRLVVCQVQGIWAVNDSTLKVLRDRVTAMLAVIRGHHVEVTFEWIPRARNFRADHEANLAFVPAKPTRSHDS